MATKQLSDGGTDGTVLGQGTSDKIGFHGVTPVVQNTGVGTSTITTAVTTTSEAAGFATTTQATDLMNIVAQMRTALQNAGLISS